MKQLSEGQLVFCIINGISFYDSSRLGNDLFTVLSTLMDLVIDGELQAVFKLMMSAPVMRRSLTRNCDQARVLTLPKDMGYTSQRFNVQAYENEAKHKTRVLKRSVRPEPALLIDDSDQGLGNSGMSE